MMEDVQMLIDFSGLTPSRQSLQTLKEIKHELIGNDKQAYFEKGLIDSIMPLVSAETD